MLRILEDPKSPTIRDPSGRNSNPMGSWKVASLSALPSWVPDTPSMPATVDTTPEERERDRKREREKNETEREREMISKQTVETNHNTTHH